MKIRHFKARDVHGYLDFDFELLPDITFLTGLNGSGKTTALQLLAALLGPRLESLRSVEFSSCEVTIEIDDKKITVGAQKTVDFLELRISSIPQALSIPLLELEALKDAVGHDTKWTPTHERISRDEVFNAIYTVASPLLLGLDRRHDSRDNLLTQLDEQARPRTRRWREFVHETTPSLTDVSNLVRDTFLELREEVDRLDTKLRDSLLLDSLKLIPPSPNQSADNPHGLPQKILKQKRTEIIKSLMALRVPSKDYIEAIDGFFNEVERMSTAVSAIDMKKIFQGGPTSGGLKDIEVLSEWLVNRAQIEKINQHIDQLLRYQEERDVIFEPLDRCTRLINYFFEQTGKQVELSMRGDFRVHVQAAPQPAMPKTLRALSSGERQIVVMLAHLTLNASLKESGVFIVDEPELSLHLSWQEKFVAAVREANPNVQLILATHSPAIILDLEDHCRGV